jgi:hypothetical protein
LYLIFLHDARRGGERALTGFVSSALVGLRYGLPFSHTVGDVKAEFDVLRVGHARADEQGQGKSDGC